MTLLKERGRLDDNDARAFLLSNTAEERIEALGRFHRIAPQRDRNIRARGRVQRVVSAILFAGLAEVKLVYAKNAKWVLSGPH